MKKNELQKILKPLIKECIKEVIFEEGVLSRLRHQSQNMTSQGSASSFKKTRNEPWQRKKEN